MAIIIKIYQFFLSFIYFLLKLIPFKQKVVFLSRQDNNPSLDFNMLKIEIEKEHPEYKIIVLCKKMDDGFLGSIAYFFHILKQMYHLATSRIAIIDSYIIPVSILTHKKELLIIQLWHSIGTMKKFGYSIIDMIEGSSSKLVNLMKMHKNYDYILAAGPGYVDHLMEGFNYPQERIVIYPLPRVELLLNEDYKKNIKTKIYESYPQLNGKTNIVYCPTFRISDKYDISEAIHALINEIDLNKYNLIIKLHPLTKLRIDNKDVIFDTNFSTVEMIVAGDIIISDYSSIIYEAAIVNKPIYFYAYDYEEYMLTREVYLDYYQEMPGPICDNAYDLIKSIEKNSYDYKKLYTFLTKYVEIRGNQQTKDIVEFIFNNLK